MWQRLPLEKKRRPPGYAPRTDGLVPSSDWVRCARRPRDARRGPRVRWRSDGTTNFPCALRTCRRFQSNGTTSPTPGFSSSSTPAAIETSDGGARRIGAGYRAEAHGHPLFWERHDGALVTGAACSISCRCRLRGPCMSATPRPRRMRGGAARGCRPRPNISARPSGRPMVSGGIHGETPSLPPRTASSISRAGIRNPPAAIQRARARGVSRTWSAMDGSGRARCSRRFQDSAPWRRIPVLGRLLRRRALRRQGRLARDRARASEADIPQLVPRPLPVCVRHVSMREEWR